MIIGKTMDLGDQAGSEKKICFDCKTSKTPLWRYGPNGPKSLCNACGIKFRKTKPKGFRCISTEGIGIGVNNRFYGTNGSNEKVIREKKGFRYHNHGGDNNVIEVKGFSSGKKGTRSVSTKEDKKKRIEKRNSNMLKLRLLAFGREVLMKRSESQRKLGEEEEAAVLLMALSCGSVHA